jgi:hypothetical protein
MVVELDDVLMVHRVQDIDLVLHLLNQVLGLEVLLLYLLQCHPLVSELVLCPNDLR